MKKSLITVFILMIIVLILSSAVYGSYDDVERWPDESQYPEITQCPYVLVAYTPDGSWMGSYEFYYFYTMPVIEYYQSENEIWTFTADESLPKEMILITWNNIQQVWSKTVLTGCARYDYNNVFVYSNFNSAAYATCDIYSPEQDEIYYGEYPYLRTWVASEFETVDIRSYFWPDSQPGWRMTKSWYDIERPTDGIKEIASDEIPYGIGLNRIEVSSGGQTLENVTFTVSPVIDNSAYIEGIEDGREYEDPPTIIVIKKNYVDPVTLYVNNFPITRIIESTKNVYLTPYITQPKLGPNTFELKKDDGTIVDIKTITILRQPSYEMIPGDSGPGGGGGGGAFPSDDDLTYAIGAAPERSDYTDDIWGEVNYGFDTLMYWLKYPFVVLGKLVYDTAQDVKKTAEELSGISKLTRELLSFLPPQILALLTLLVGLTVIFTVIKLIRG